MKRFKNYPFFIMVIFSLNSCDFFYQNDFIKTEKITEVENMQIIYSLYQTGIDNYRYEFKIIQLKDTTDLFNAILNDATGNNSLFDIKSENGEVYIKSNKPIGKYTKVINGYRFKLEGVY